MRKMFEVCSRSHRPSKTLKRVRIEVITEGDVVQEIYEWQLSKGARELLTKRLIGFVKADDEKPDGS